MLEKITESKSCKQCNASFDILDKDLEFYKKISPKFNAEVFEVPIPEICPDCDMQIKLSFRNERNLYKRKCSATGKDIITIFSPDKDLVVYDQDYWWSDKWDRDKYFLDIDFEKPFFDQFNELLKIVPKRALVRGTGSENSPYASGVGASKDCHLVFDSTDIEKCYYGNRFAFCTNCIDCTGVSNSENCYDLINSVNCYEVFHSENCIDCSNSKYLSNCKGSSNCFASVNLLNKKYHIFNVEYTKEEYFERLKEIEQNGFGEEDFNKLKKTFPKQNLTNINSENAIGDKIYNSKDVNYSFDVSDSNNINYSAVVFRNSSDVYNSYVCLNNSNNIYSSIVINKRCSNILFCNDAWNECSNLIYCCECKTAKNCFLCTGIVNREYCILNKQYSKEEYEELVPKIIKQMIKNNEWGKFFTGETSLFGYNETVAIEHFILQKEEAVQKGFKWSDYVPELPKVEKIIQADKLPDKITDIPDDILNWAIECEKTKKPFRIIKGELDFYRKYNLPIPTKHHDIRHLERFKKINPRKLFATNCSSCNSIIHTSYMDTENIYCEECYKKEIY